MMLTITVVALMFMFIGFCAREVFNTVVRELEDIKKANEFVENSLAER